MTATEDMLFDGIEQLRDDLLAVQIHLKRGDTDATADALKRAAEGMREVAAALDNEGGTA